MKKQNTLFTILSVLGIIVAIFLLMKIYLNYQFVISGATLSFLQIFSSNINSSLQSLGFWFRDLWHFNSIRNQNSQLVAEKLELINQIHQLLPLKEENETLRNALKMQQEKSWRFAMAKIIFIDPTSLSGYFWLDKGAGDGLKEGMNLIDKNGILVGKLVKCLENYCQGEFALSSGIKIGVKDLRSNVLAILDKDNQGNFRLKLLPPLADIKDGDVLVTSVENSDFIGGLLVGQLKEIKSSPNVELEKRFIVKPFLNQKQFSEVLVITDFIP